MLRNDAHRKIFFSMNLIGFEFLGKFWIFDIIRADICTHPKYTPHSPLLASYLVVQVQLGKKERHDPGYQNKGQRIEPGT